MELLQRRVTECETMQVGEEVESTVDSDRSIDGSAHTYHWCMLDTGRAAARHMWAVGAADSVLPAAAAVPAEPDERFQFTVLQQYCTISSTSSS